MSAEVKKVGCALCSVFETKFNEIVPSFVPLFPEDVVEPESSVKSQNEEPPLILDSCGIFKCVTCEYEFDTREEQMDHFRSSWHESNLCRKQKGLCLLSEQDFDDEQGSDDETETSSETPDQMPSEILNQITTPFTYYVSNDMVYGIHKVILDRDKTLHSQFNDTKWLIILLAGGRFAAAVFQRDTLLHHKALQRYTVRAKQGGSQGARDGAQGGKQPKSAGASLRRYNEAALAKDIESLMDDWKSDISQCNRIFLRCSAYHRSMFVGGVFKKKDCRIQSIPFVTRKPTFQEVKRVQYRLSNVVFWGDKTSALASLRTKVVEKRPLDTKKDVENRPPPTQEMPVKPKEDHRKKGKKEGSRIIPGEERLTIESLLIQPKIQQLEEKEWQIFYTNVMLRKVDQILCAYAEYKRVGGDSWLNYVGSLNQVVTTGKVDGTILHTVAKAGQIEMVSTLLRVEADPTVTNSKGFVPYQEAIDKPTRKEFVNFRAECEADESSPRIIDWNKAMIPAPLAPEVEADRAAQLAEKRKRQNLARKQRQKAENIVKAGVRKEEEEKHRYLVLSDREKRALAAEKRILAGFEKEKPVLSRCFQCAKNITGQTPFEYDNNRFCTTLCVRAHRNL